MKQTKEQMISEARNWSCETINKICKPLAKLTKKEDPTDTTKILRIIRDYFESLYLNKLKKVINF